MEKELIDNLTATQNRCNALLNDRRELKGLIREALAGIDDPEIVCDRGATDEWASRAKAALERMK